MKVRPVLRRAGLALIAAGVGAAGCSDHRGGVSAVGPEGGKSGPFRLAKVATQEVSRHRTVVVARVTRGGAPVAGVQVWCSRAISGLAPRYQWMGTTGPDGRAEIGISEEGQGFRRAGVNGLYRVQAIDPATGGVVGMWSSVPFNGGRNTQVELRVGELARILSDSPLSEPAEFIAGAQDLAGYRNWQAVDYTIGATNPASGPAHNSTLNAFSRRVFRNAATALSGGEYAKGSILVKEVFTWENGQKKHPEMGVLAMAKRGGGFNAGGGDGSG